MDQYGVATSSTSTAMGGIEQQDRKIEYYFSMANVKAFIQSIEWPIIKHLSYRLSVPSIIDFLDYFDTQCQVLMYVDW